jgi:preprotein translocase subunit YajC
MDFFISNAHAQAAGGSESLLGLLPLVLIFVVFYFLLIRPQTKRQKEHREMMISGSIRFRFR